MKQLDFTSTVLSKVIVAEVECSGTSLRVTISVRSLLCSLRIVTRSRSQVLTFLSLWIGVLMVRDIKENFVIIKHCDNKIL